MANNGIVLIDSATKRRAEISHLLGSKGISVEPFDSAEDFKAYPVEAALYLVADEGDLLKSVLDASSVLNRFPTVIAYGETLCAKRIVEAMKAGAANYIVWPFDETILELTLGNLAVGHSNIALIRSRVLRAKRKLAALSERELQVVELIAAGLSSKEVGLRLKISHRTVEIHRANAMAKLEVKNVAQLVRLAVESTIEESPAAVGTLVA